MARHSLILDSSGNPYLSPEARRGAASGWPGGGLENARSGLGGQNDKALAAQYIRRIFANYYVLDTLYQQVWSIKKGTGAPPRDAFKNWRTWEEEAEVMEDAERELWVKPALTQWMIAGRLYGTALLVMIIGDTPLEEPLDPLEVREGELQALQPFHRYRAVVKDFVSDLRDKRYGWPEAYEISTRFGQRFEVHHTRVLRYDGVQLPAQPDDNWEGWGESLVASVLDPAMQESQSASAIVQLVQEASIPVIMAQELTEADLSDSEELEQLAQAVSLAKSVWNTVFLPAGAVLERTNVPFSGLDSIVDRQFLRLAAAFDMPLTRFMNQSPAGQNATGESDLKNYDTTLAELRDDIEQPCSVLDTVLARHAGLPEAPPSTWRSYLEASRKEEAEAAKLEAEAWAILTTNYIAAEDVAAAALSGSPIFGELPEPPDAPEPDMLLPGSGDEGDGDETGDDGNGNGDGGGDGDGE